MKLRVSNPGEPAKPVRVLLEKGDKPYGSVTTYPAGWTPPDVGEMWDEKHAVVSGRPGRGDATWDEIILTICEEKAEQRQVDKLGDEQS